MICIELLTLVFLTTLNFVNIQNKTILKQTKAIKNNLVMAKICPYKKTLIHFNLS